MSAIHQQVYQNGVTVGGAVALDMARGDATEDLAWDLALGALDDCMNEDMPRPTRERAGEWLLGFARGLVVQ